MKTVFLETDRLILRYITQQDFDELKSMLQDSDVMYAWEYTFTDNDIQDWIDKNLSLYKKNSLGFFIVEDMHSGVVVGQAALKKDIINNQEYYEIGYILKKAYWHNGYAAECAEALSRYAFEKLGLSEVIFEIRPNNTASRKVAERLNAKLDGKFVKNVRGKEMPHLIYKLTL